MHLNQKLGLGSMLVLQRLVRFYNYLNVVSALVAGLSLAVMTFNEFHPPDSDLIPAAEGLLTSSAITAVVSLMIATMLLFRFEGHETATVADLIAAWTPLVLLDLAIVENLLGTVLWYASKNTAWRTALVSSQLAFLLILTSWMAVWMFRTMKQRGGMGQEELRALSGARRVADK